MVRQVYRLDLKDAAMAENSVIRALLDNVPRGVIAYIREIYVGGMQIFTFDDRLLMTNDAPDGGDRGSRIASKTSIKWDALKLICSSARLATKLMMPSGVRSV